MRSIVRSENDDLCTIWCVPAMSAERFTPEDLDAFLEAHPTPAGTIAPHTYLNATVTVSERYARVGDRICPQWIEVVAEGSADEPTFTSRVEVIDGEPCVVSLTFEKRSLAEREVRQTDLRSVEVSAMVLLLAGFSLVLERDIDGSVRAIPGTEDVERALTELRSERRNRRLTRTFLGEVADVYRENFNGTPAQAVADKYHVSLRTASKWIHEARATGLLPPTTRGKKRA